MRSRRVRWCLIGGVVVLGLGLASAGLAWALLRHRPDFYLRAAAQAPVAEQKREARAFLNSSLQLRNDVTNEAAWEAEFSDREVNAWLARDLVEHFADQIPPNVTDPRVVFEPGRLTLAFGWHGEPLDAVVWAVIQVRVTEPNTLLLTVEKLRAGALPIPPERVLPGLIAHARRYGLDVTWDASDRPQEVQIQCGPTGPWEAGSPTIRLEEVELGLGRLRLAGRSDTRGAGPSRIATVRLPDRDQLRAAFPDPVGVGVKRTRQIAPERTGPPTAPSEGVEVEAARSRAVPRS
jgi:hypothetical protein